MEKSCTVRPTIDILKKHAKSLFQKPRLFASSRPCLLVFGLYFGTYGTANFATSIAHSGFLDLEPAAANTLTVLATLSANVPLGIYKDTVFARLFGCPKLPGPAPGKPLPISIPPPTPRTPLSTYIGFLVRDIITIHTSFTLPATLSSSIPDSLLPDPQSKAVLAQLFVPVLGQIVNTPIHLVALAIYNKQGSLTMSEALTTLRMNLIPASLTRMMRIIPAFGFGTLTNNEVRLALLDRLDTAEDLRGND